MFAGVAAALQAIAAGFVSIQIPLAGVCFAGTLIAVLIHVIAFRGVFVVAVATILLFSAANIIAAIPAG
jgi:hypothetical protein